MLHDRAGLLTGLGVGITVMYFLDPDRGRRRRALVGDQLTRAGRVSREAVGATTRDVAHRTSGAAARLRTALHRETSDDIVIIERVRAQLGRFVSHPHALDVLAENGVVTLRGPILRAEVNRLLNAVERVRGVRDVVSELEEHEEPGNLPALQGGSHPSGPMEQIRFGQWSPAMRFLTGASALALTSYGASRRDIAGSVVAAFGLALLARAGTNADVRRLNLFSPVSD
jgi:osmotically-inducible protein OsmY